MRSETRWNRGGGRRAGDHRLARIQLAADPLQPRDRLRGQDYGERLMTHTGVRLLYALHRFDPLSFARSLAVELLAAGCRPSRNRCDLQGRCEKRRSI